MSPAPLTRDEMTAWSRYVHEVCGVDLDDSKSYLVETRLGSLMRETGADGFSELLYRVRSDMSGALRNRVIDAITTNETSFFRDTSPFELLQHKLIPELVDRRRAAGLRPIPIRILSAACSTGQEVYSTAAVLYELLGDMRNYDVRILGLDISDAAVKQASYAHYTRLELDRGMTQDRLMRHFEAVGDRWKVRDELRSMATFRRANLLEPLAVPHQFDLIFCRNVAIYFSEPDRATMYRNLLRALARDGALIIGSTESIGGLCPELVSRRYLRAVYYERETAAAATHPAPSLPGAWA
jgi:chemotaxis protein methyltransferase CheR